MLRFWHFGWEEHGELTGNKNKMGGSEWEMTEAGIKLGSSHSMYTTQQEHLCVCVYIYMYIYTLYVNKHIHVGCFEKQKI